MKPLLLAAVSALALPMMAMADPVYMIAQIQIEDQETYFNKYGAGVFPILMDTGAKVLVASPTVNSLEGEWAGNWTVVIEFPNEEAALDQWYNSDAYVEVRQIRLAATSFGNMIVAPAFVPPQQ
jgi:uncharacterized protein (DUF1330 family)